MNIHERFLDLERLVIAIDGPRSTRQGLLLEHIAAISAEYYRLEVRLSLIEKQLKYTADLAEQRLLNHLNIDAEHIIAIAESLPAADYSELSQMNENLEPIRCPTIQVEPIDFNYET